jgi:hypothetical protein
MASIDNDKFDIADANAADQIYRAGGRGLRPRYRKSSVIVSLGPRFGLTLAD